MSLGQIVLFSLATVFFAIGVHQTFVLSNPPHNLSVSESLTGSYFIFMLSIGCLLAYAYLKNKQKQKKK